PSAATSTFLTMPSSVMGRWISGSCTPSSALVTCSALGGLVGEVIDSCYPRLGGASFPDSVAHPVPKKVPGGPPSPLRPVPPGETGTAATVGHGRGRSPRVRRGYCLTTAPVVGLRMTGLQRGAKNWNIPVRLPEIASKEPPPIRFPPSQLFSMNPMTEVVSVCWLLTKFAFDHGEITSIGSRWL